MLTGLEWEVAKEDVAVGEVVAPIVLVTDVECLNHNVDARREDVLSVRGHFVSPMTPHSKRF